jgi:hypothetical protein
VADVMSILGAAYKSAGAVVPSRTKYVAVDPKLYEGNWTGKYADNKSVSVTVSGVNGFHAKVKYQSAGTVKYQDVMIKDQAFRIGDAKFLLAGNGKATIKNIVSDPASGQSYLDTAQLIRK